MADSDAMPGENGGAKPQGTPRLVQIDAMVAGEDAVKLWSLLRRFAAGVFSPDDAGPQPPPPLLHRIRSACAESAPHLREACGNSGADLLRWARRGSPLRALLVVSQLLLERWMWKANGADDLVPEFSLHWFVICFVGQECPAWHARVHFLMFGWMMSVGAACSAFCVVCAWCAQYVEHVMPTKDLIYVGTIALLALTGLLVFMLFFLVATFNAIIISFLMSLAAAGGFLALFFACLTAIYIGALSVAMFILSTITFSAIIAAFVTTGWIGFLWVIWLSVKKGMDLTKQSLSMTGSALSAYSAARQVHHQQSKKGME